MREWAEYSISQDEDGAVLVLAGPLVISTIAALDRELRQLAQDFVRIDLAQVSVMDTVGAWTAWRIAHDCGAQLVGASSDAQILIDAVQSDGSTTAMAPARAPFHVHVPQTIGAGVIEWARGVVQLISFLGAVIAAFGMILRHPSRMRMRALVHQLELVGVNSLGIIGLMSLLIGLVIAQQGAVQLRQFGAEIYTINLTGRLSLRELGVLMTAIMVAGRSGSAFAAQIGTMKLTEEVDAMRTIGVSPVEALVVPRILAAVLMMPLLGFFSSVLAIIGGALLADIALDIPFFTFLSRIQEVVPMYDVWVGLVKAPVFGLIVALAGCYQGMQVKSNSEEVGQRTTRAVVQAIFMVIVLDAFFAVFFTEVGWA